jgi:hypothetical protein
VADLTRPEYYWQERWRKPKASFTQEYLDDLPIETDAVKIYIDGNEVVRENKKVHYPHTILVKGQSGGQLLADIEGSFVDLNKNINLHENLTDFDTGIMAEEIFTESLVITPSTNYSALFQSKSDLSNKQSHYAYEPNVKGTGKSGLSVEERIVALEGALVEAYELIEELNQEILKLKTRK